MQNLSRLYLILDLMILITLPVVAAGGNSDAAPPVTAGDPVWDTMSDTWVATDDLGRRTPLHEETGPLRPGKTVALFYYIWHGEHSTGLYDISEILDGNPEDPQWGPEGTFHFYSEPIYGYYLATDPYVHRKNAQFLADAGVDVIFFDVTNSFTYPGVYRDVICPLFTEIRARGGRTPQIGFLTHSGSGATVQRIYEDFYAKNLYPELWFEWDGKPLILATPGEMSAEMREFFTVRYSWAWSPGQDCWPWLENFPQQGGWHTSPDQVEQMVVETAQHPTGNEGWGVGKSQTSENPRPSPQDYQTEKGLHFAEYWQRALDVDPEVIFITQWNEWVAQRFVASEPIRYIGQMLQAGDSYFVDVYSPEFNRDIEPMVGGYRDNYYYQMVDGIRRFKGTRPLPKASGPKTIDLGDFATWDTVAPVYRDDIGDPSRRDHPGWGSEHYTNATGRNDLKLMKVARDEHNLYFYAETADALSRPDSQNWMRLFIGIDDARQTPTWEGFHYLVQPQSDVPDASLALYAAWDGDWRKVGELKSHREANHLALAIPRALLRLRPGHPLALRFKWADNMQSFDPLDWTLNGDTAPNNRFQYRYREQKANPD